MDPVFCFKLGNLKSAEKNRLEVEVRIGNTPNFLVAFVNQPFFALIQRQWNSTKLFTRTSFNVKFIFSPSGQIFVFQKIKAVRMESKNQQDQGQHGQNLFPV